jgi:hypothetical protein
VGGRGGAAERGWGGGGLGRRDAEREAGSGRGLDPAQSGPPSLACRGSPRWRVAAASRAGFGCAPLAPAARPPRPAPAPCAGPVPSESESESLGCQCAADSERHALTTIQVQCLRCSESVTVLRRSQCSESVLRVSLAWQCSESVPRVTQLAVLRVSAAALRAEARPGRAAGPARRRLACVEAPPGRIRLGVGRSSARYGGPAAGPAVHAGPDDPPPPPPPAGRAISPARMTRRARDRGVRPGPEWDAESDAGYGRAGTGLTAVRRTGHG